MFLFTLIKASSPEAFYPNYDTPTMLEQTTQSQNYTLDCITNNLNLAGKAAEQLLLQDTDTREILRRLETQFLKYESHQYVEDMMDLIKVGALILKIDSCKISKIIQIFLCQLSVCWIYQIETILNFIIPIWHDKQYTEIKYILINRFEKLLKEDYSLYCLEDLASNILRIDPTQMVPKILPKLEQVLLKIDSDKQNIKENLEALIARYKEFL